MYAVNKAERLLLRCRIGGKRVGGLLQTLVRGPLGAWPVGRDLREVRAAWLGGVGVGSMCKGPEAGNSRLRGWVCWQRVVNESLLPGLYLG